MLKCALCAIWFRQHCTHAVHQPLLYLHEPITEFGPPPLPPLPFPSPLLFPATPPANSGCWSNIGQVKLFGRCVQERPPSCLHAGGTSRANVAPSLCPARPPTGFSATTHDAPGRAMIPSSKSYCLHRFGSSHFAATWSPSRLQIFCRYHDSLCGFRASSLSR